MDSFLLLHKICSVQSPEQCKYVLLITTLNPSFSYLVGLRFSGLNGMAYTPSKNAPTPESLLPRADSKNPVSTCRGITAKGRPCRNSLAALNSSLNNRRASAPSETNTNTGQYLRDAYCYLHKDQALQSCSNQFEENRRPTPAGKRASTDTLYAKFDGYELSSNGIQNAERQRRPTYKKRPKKKKQPCFWEILCCMSMPRSDSEEDDYVEIVRHKRRIQAAAESRNSTRPAMTTAQSESLPPHPQAITQTGRPRPHRMPASAPAAPTSSPTQSLLKYIPPSLDAKTTANLLAELGKPVSDGDDAGYIYIFWLTPESRAAWKPTDDDAESLLQAPLQGIPRDSPSQTDLLRTHSVVRRPRASTRGPSPSDERRTILLKIGRASNVHRRMGEWTRQCGYNPSLIRFYPYVSSTLLNRTSPSPTQRPSSSAVRYPSLTPPSPPSPSVRKVPYSHRVERLIHIELAASRSKDQGKCGACGREHREWFEVEASKDGVKAVDAVVRRWVGWAEDATRNGMNV